MLVALQLVVVAVVPLNLTVLVPWVEPKFVPVIVTEAPTAPEVGDKPVMLGGAAWASRAKSKTKHPTKMRMDFRLNRCMIQPSEAFTSAKALSASLENSNTYCCG